MSLRLLVACVSVCLLGSCVTFVDQGGADPWWTYGGSPAAQRYSALTQINAHTVHDLRQAWRFDMAGSGDPETNPLIVDGTLYGYTPTLQVFALDAASGTLKWRFDPGIVGSGPSRGFSYWTDGHSSRLFAGVMQFLFALDPRTGLPLADFGDHGHIDLRQGLRGDGSRYFVSLTSPGVIYHDLIITGFRTSEVKPAPPADIRAFDVHSGALRWVFHTIPAAGEPGAQTWPAGAREVSGSANNWAGMALDARRGIVYVPTGSAVNDFYGADRLGDDLYANCLLALDAATGKLLWYRQLVHHDIEDRDLPSAPSLLRIRHDGRLRDVVAQPTKQGFLFVFDRATGEPIFPIEERPTPQSEVPGEHAAATQPQSDVPAPYARQYLTEQLLTNRTPVAHQWALEHFRAMRSEGPFTPPGLSRPTVIFPGFDGGAEWGGAAVDPRTATLYINANDLAWSAQLAPTPQARGPGGKAYLALCIACHGPDRRGSPPAFPSLVDIDRRLSPDQVAAVIHTGRGRMPAFAQLQGAELEALITYVRTGTDEPDDGAARAQREAIPFPVADASAPYQFTGYKKFLDPDGYPAVAPPWGTLSAIDLNTGRYRWRIPLGEYPQLAAEGLAVTGTENYGGPLATAGGLILIGATVFDHKLRALDSATGRLLWETELPYAGTATPATYSIRGKQYVVIETNNARNHDAPQGAAYVAYSLP
ncbi:MAG TPA: PQQ-binding-like beta-propeller repeat protein [Steroidobacteraceae bacterium]|nr:PQQ-binding-like beta-propeller repeat protein [Steroidobacteraceae bacterium]